MGISTFKGMRIKLIVGVLLLSGCAHIEQDVDKPFDLAVYLAEHRYSEAISILTSKAPSEGADLPSIERVLLEAEHYAVQQIGKAQAESEGKRWQKGLYLLNQTKERVPLDLWPILQQEIDVIEAQRALDHDVVRIKSSIEYVQFLKQQRIYYQLKLADKPSSLWLKFKLVTLDRLLLKHAEQLVEDGLYTFRRDDYLLANRIYGALAGIALPIEIERGRVALGYNLLDNYGMESADSDSVGKRRYKSSPEKAYSADKEGVSAPIKIAIPGPVDQARLLVSLRSAVRAGKLFETKQLLTALRRRQLSVEQSLEVDAIELRLSEQISLLDKHADDLYRQGHVDQANGVWALLIRLDENNRHVKAKYERSETVIDNIKTLRAEGFSTEIAK